MALIFRNIIDYSPDLEKFTIGYYRIGKIYFYEIFPSSILGS